MPVVVLPNTISAGQPVAAAPIQGNFVTLRNAINGGLDAANLSDGAVTSGKLANESVTSSKLAVDSVTTPAILNLSVTSAKLDDGAVTTNKIFSGAVTSDKLGIDSVTSSKIADGNVTSDKLGPFSVTYDKLGGGVVRTRQNFAPHLLYGRIVVTGGGSTSLVGFPDTLTVTRVAAGNYRINYGVNIDSETIQTFAAVDETLENINIVNTITNVPGVLYYRPLIWNGSSWIPYGEPVTIRVAIIGENIIL